jgi:hippurate hydrolase
MYPEILAQSQALTALRRDIHAHPELSYQEVRTAGVVAQFLRACGLEVTTGVGRTGVVGQLRRGNGKRALGLTAEMDALPLGEANRFAHRSKTPGKMHAGGHDGHTVMLLGAAQHLAAHGRFDGTVNFFFRPAEEHGAGARAMLDDGLFERFPCDEIYGIHNVPHIPAGHIGSRTGAVTATTASFHIQVTGKGGHTARPHLAVDPIVVSSHIVSALQALVSRMSDPLQPIALGISRIEAGQPELGSIIPETAELEGSLRCYSDTAAARLMEDMRHMVEHVAQAFRARAELQPQFGYPASVCARQPVEAALAVAENLLGKERVVRDVEPTMAADDFSYMLQRCPGAFLFLGNGDGKHRGDWEGMGPCVVHNPWYDFNDELLPLGASFWSALVQERLR